MATKTGIRHANEAAAHQLLATWGSLSRAVEELHIDLLNASQDELAPDVDMPLERLGAVLMLVESIRNDLPQLSEWLDRIEHDAATMYHEQRHQKLLP